MEFVFSLMDVVTEKIIEFLYVWKYANILQTLRSIHFLLCEENIQYSYGKPQKSFFFSGRFFAASLQHSETRTSCP